MQVRPAAQSVASMHGPPSTPLPALKHAKAGGAQLVARQVLPAPHIAAPAGVCPLQPETVPPSVVPPLPAEPPLPPLPAAPPVAPLVVVVDLPPDPVALVELLLVVMEPLVPVLVIADPPPPEVRGGWLSPLLEQLHVAASKMIELMSRIGRRQEKIAAPIFICASYWVAESAGANETATRFLS